ncbi:MAG: hypothetical protein SZ59_C0001G0064 [candidate division TM6 bacterium GW2011_GWF2_28_16]|nr:MAG: hypothetical protein SZ59_C0001G0064 [candidate division TM6 bacterium GW2011_GWF2_28_16]
MKINKVLFSALIIAFTFIFSGYILSKKSTKNYDDRIKKIEQLKKNLYADKIAPEKYSDAIVQARKTMPIPKYSAKDPSLDIIKYVLEKDKYTLTDADIKNIFKALFVCSLKQKFPINPITVTRAIKLFSKLYAKTKNRMPKNNIKLLASNDNKLLAYSGVGPGYSTDTTSIIIYFIIDLLAAIFR